jgi:hypothetical protein
MDMDTNTNIGKKLAQLSTFLDQVGLRLVASNMELLAVDENGTVYRIKTRQGLPEVPDILGESLLAEKVE